MKTIKLLTLLTLFFSLTLIQSCEDDPCDAITCLNDSDCLDGTCLCLTGYSGTNCGLHCSKDIFGTWVVTGGTNNFCVLDTYLFEHGVRDTEIIITLNIGSDSVTGIGTLSLDCSSMTYTVNTAGGDVSGSITFNGTMLTDLIDAGCTLEATKQ